MAANTKHLTISRVHGRESSVKTIERMLTSEHVGLPGISKEGSLTNFLGVEAGEKQRQGSESRRAGDKAVLHAEHCREGR